MADVNITELRQNLPGYLKQVERGEEIAVTVRGRVIARIVPEGPVSARVQARARLAALRGCIALGDVLSPTGERWEADAGDL
jgi:prevent-host-death family protein